MNNKYDLYYFIIVINEISYLFSAIWAFVDVVIFHIIKAIFTYLMSAIFEFDEI